MNSAKIWINCTSICKEDHFRGIFFFFFFQNMAMWMMMLFLVWRGWPKRREGKPTSLFLNGSHSLLFNKYLMTQRSRVSDKRAASLCQTIQNCCWTLETVRIDRLKIKHIPYYSEIPWVKTSANSSSWGIYITVYNLGTLQDLVLNSYWVT